MDKKTGRPPNSLSVIRRSDGARATARRISAELDVAVLTVTQGAEWTKALEPPTFGRVGRDHAAELHDCEAVGFPLWQMDPHDEQRNAAELHGTIRVTEDMESGLLVMRDSLLADVSIPDGDSDDRAMNSPWGGLSGALVFHNGIALGVVIEHHPRQGGAAVRIMPIERLAAVSARADGPEMSVASALGLATAEELPRVEVALHLGRHKPRKIWRVPFPVDPDFIGRDEELSLLSASLIPGVRAVVTQAISGLGGIGKTQLAAHVAHAVASRFHIIWWVEADQRLTIEASLRALGKTMGLGADSTSMDVLSELSALDSSVNWMLIYDNVESPESLHGVLPTRGFGVVLITTQCQDWPTWASVTDLQPLGEDAATTLLSKSSGRDREIARRVANSFGRLPLFVAQAAAQIRSGISLSQYEELLKARFIDAIGAKVSLPGYERPALDVVLLARDAAVAAASAAQRLLTLLALMDPDGVEDTLLQRIPEGDPLADPLDRSAALAALKRFSLVREIEGDSRAYAMHRVVQEIIRQTCAEDLEDISRLALHTVKNYIQGGDWISRHNFQWRAANQLKQFLETAETFHPRETVAILNRLSYGSQIDAGLDGTSVWAARAALEIVERNSEFSEDDLVAALLRVHNAEKHGRMDHSQRDTAAIRRALAIQRKSGSQDPLTVAALELELARTLAGQFHWWVEFDFPEADLLEAEVLADSAISALQRDESARLNLASARALRAGIVGHLRRADEAVAEYCGAIALAEADGSAWWGRVSAGYALSKFGRIAAARQTVTPLLCRLNDDSEDPVKRATFEETLHRIYSSCLWEQRDWRGYLQYAEAKRERARRRSRRGSIESDLIGTYYELLPLRTAYEALGRSVEADECDHQIESIAITHIVSELNRREMGPLRQKPNPDEMVAMLESASKGKDLPVGVDWLYDLRSFKSRPDLRIRVAQAERATRELQAAQKSSSNPSRVHSDLIFYSIAREASQLAETNWDVAVSTLGQARSMVDRGEASIPKDELARAYVEVASAAAQPESLILAETAVALLTSDAGYDSDHSILSSCTVPTLLSRAGEIMAELDRDFKRARNLELTAVALEERVHGRISPGVSMYLFNAGQYAASANEFVGPIGAISLLEESLDIASTCFGRECPRWATRAAELAAVVRDINRGRARSLLLHAAAIFTEYYGPDHQLVTECETAINGLNG
ncbi:hypothetical protein [Kitasatospora sp. NPDC097691]|uniref:DUF7779 domain-containing protein n=1 Tax=Kitasatospora sp. NPDC097691 TaxID=3157231 RepID=UPI003331EADD